jgi:2,3-dihydroxybenzoate decarboxylase
MGSSRSIAAAVYQRIATEEAWGPPEMFERYRRLLADKSVDDPGFNSMWGFYLLSGSERATQIVERLQDIGERRIADMDATGIAKQIVSLTSPGVQVFEKADAVALAASSNDQLAAAIRRNPDRARRGRAAGSGGRCEGARARRAPARAQGGDHQLAHARRVSR